MTKVCLRYAQATDPAATDPKVVLSTALNRSIIGITAVGEVPQRNSPRDEYRNLTVFQP